MFEHVLQIAEILHIGSGLHFVEMFVFVVRLFSPFREVLHDIAEVFQSVGIGFHYVVRKVFSLCARVFIFAFPSEPQSRIGFEFLGNHFGKRLLFSILVFVFVAVIAISPFDCPFVVDTYARIESFAADIVFGLCHIVKTRIVHNRSSMPIGFNPFFVAEFFDRRLTAGAHIVAQT